MRRKSLTPLILGLIALAGNLRGDEAATLAAFEFEAPGDLRPSLAAPGVRVSELSIGGEFADQVTTNDGVLRIPSHLPPAPGSGRGRSHGENYLEFTLTAPEGRTLRVDSIILDRRASAEGPWGYTRVRTDRDGFSENIAMKPDIFGASWSKAKGTFKAEEFPAPSVTIRIYVLAMKGKADLGLTLDNIRVEGEILPASSH